MLTIRVCAGEGIDGPQLSICVESHDTCCKENRCDQPTSVYTELIPVLRMDPLFLNRDLAREIHGLLSRFPDSMSPFVNTTSGEYNARFSYNARFLCLSFQA